MKSCAVVFTYPGDYLKAARLTKSIKEHVDTVFFCIESKDINVPLPDWATPLVIDFDRCYQLHGTEAIIGMKSVYKTLVEMGYDRVIKLDSDTYVFRPDWFIKPLECGSDFVYIRRIMTTKNHAIMRRANGCCYAMTSKAIRELLKVTSKVIDEIMMANDRHEDLVFSHIFNEVVNINIHDVDKTKVWWAARPYRQPDCIVGHFGYCDIERIKEEINQINPLIVDEIFSKDTEEYCKKLIEYAEANNIKIKEYKNIYTPDGQLIEEGSENPVSGNYPPTRPPAAPEAQQKIILPEN